MLDRIIGAAKYSQRRVAARCIVSSGLIVKNDVRGLVAQYLSEPFRAPADEALASAQFDGQPSGILTDPSTKFSRFTPDGMKAIPPGSDIPLTIGVTNPVVRLVCETNDSIGFAAVGVAKTLTAE